MGVSKALWDAQFYLSSKHSGADFKFYRISGPPTQILVPRPLYFDNFCLKLLTLTSCRYKGPRSIAGTHFKDNLANGADHEESVLIQIANRYAEHQYTKSCLPKHSLHNENGGARGSGCLPTGKTFRITRNNIGKCPLCKTGDVLKLQ